MKMKVSTIVLAFTALVFNVQADSSTLPAPMPQFMNKEQLVKWNAEQAATYKPVATEGEPPLMFFTGKLYIPDAGGYVYKYRTYNPEMLRWTSADPSGFPDGVNNHLYAPVATYQFDSNGAQTVTDYEDFSFNLRDGGITYANLAITGGLSSIAGATLGGLLGPWGAAIGGIAAGLGGAYVDYDTAYSNFQTATNLAYPAGATVSGPQGTNTYTATKTVPDSATLQNTTTTIVVVNFGSQFDSSQIDFTAQVIYLEQFNYE